MFTSELDGLRVDDKIGQLAGDVGLLLLVGLWRVVDRRFAVAARQPVAGAGGDHHVAVQCARRRDRHAAAAARQQHGGRRRSRDRRVDDARSGTDLRRQLTTDTTRIIIIITINQHTAILTAIFPSKPALAGCSSPHLDFPSLIGFHSFIHSFIRVKHS